MDPDHLDNLEAVPPRGWRRSKPPGRSFGDVACVLSAASLRARAFFRIPERGSSDRSGQADPGAVAGPLPAEWSLGRDVLAEGPERVLG